MLNQFMQFIQQITQQSVRITIEIETFISLTQGNEQENHEQEDDYL